MPDHSLGVKLPNPSVSPTSYSNSLLLLSLLARRSTSTTLKPNSWLLPRRGARLHGFAVESRVHPRLPAHLGTRRPGEPASSQQLTSSAANRLGMRADDHQRPARRGRLVPALPFVHTPLTLEDSYKALPLRIAWRQNLVDLQPPLAREDRSGDELPTTVPRNGVEPCIARRLRRLSVSKIAAEVFDEPLTARAAPVHVAGLPFS